MLKNEVGNDGAAPAVEKATRNEGLISEFSNALSDSTALKVVGGTALVAAGAVATVAAMRYARPALETGKALGSVVDDGAFAAVKTARQEVNHKSINDAARDAVKPLMPAFEALLKESTPITAATRDAAAKTLTPATEKIVQNSIPIDLQTIARNAHSALMRNLGEAGSEAAQQRGTLETAIAKMFGRKVPMTERLGFKEVDPKIPMFPKMADITAMMPETGPNAHRVVMHLDGIPRALNLTDATAVLAERSMSYIARNPNTAKALAAQMPKPAMERDIAATAAKITQRSA